jgi:hypothetical protein
MVAHLRRGLPSMLLPIAAKSCLDRIQAQVLVPVLRALRAELGNDNADAIAKQALRDSGLAVLEGNNDQCARRLSGGSRSIPPGQGA